MKVKYAIIGAGITGCTVARLLQLQGENDFVLLEAASEAGGLCRAKNINGHVLDIGGGHFLCSRYPEVYEFIFSHLPKSEFNLFDRVSKIAIENEIIDYPIEFNLWQLSPEKGRAYLDSSLKAGEVTGGMQPSSFVEWIRWKLGERIAEYYMIPYNRKLWGVDPERMDIDWLSKIPRVDTEAILASWNQRHSDRSRMPSHDTFYYPREGGFQSIFDAISNKVQSQIWLDRPVRSLEYTGNWRINGDVDAEIVINTAPWPRIYEANGSPAELKQHIQNIEISSLVVSLHERSYSHDWHWIYRPEETLPYHREFYIHNFAPHSRIDSVYRETNLKRWTPGGGEIAFFQNDAAYPIPVRGHAGAALAIHDYYSRKNLFGVGRWGQHSYFNSDVCIREAMKLVSTLTGVRCTT